MLLLSVYEIRKIAAPKGCQVIRHMKGKDGRIRVRLLDPAGEPILAPSGADRFTLDRAVAALQARPDLPRKRAKPAP
jgi:hypothetical protein